MPMTLLDAQTERNEIFSTGEKLYFYRIRRCFSQSQLEKQAALANGTISKIEKNVVIPGSNTLFRLAEILQLDHKETAYLFGINLYADKLADCSIVSEQPDILL